MEQNKPEAQKVSKLRSSHIGQVITVIQVDDDEVTETSGILVSLIRSSSRAGKLNAVRFHLGGVEADTRSGLFFALDADEAKGGDYTFIVG